MSDIKVMQHLVEMLKISTKEEDSQELQDAVMETICAFAEKGSISSLESSPFQMIFINIFSKIMFSLVLWPLKITWKQIV